MPSALMAARAGGLRHVPVLHDCGPVTEPANPQAAAFSRWFEALPALADAIVAVSEATAADARALAAKHLPGIPFPPVSVVPVNGRTDLPADGDGPVPEEPFVLLVASLEPRKNHVLAFRAWRLLLDRRGPDATPAWSAPAAARTATRPPSPSSRPTPT
ncbi:hypothetical protein ACE7GA_14280 [Roseomonas sp. CCTCC AB2023176]|uniref:hypothetical protein n=1 Tax=Roseomonas sp. CCTCC AB2023176 TaxID=3342640 RepID=UPI0035D602E8